MNGSNPQNHIFPYSTKLGDKIKYLGTDNKEHEGEVIAIKNALCIRTEDGDIYPIQIQ